MNGHASNLAKAVLMFYGTTQWREAERAAWAKLTGRGEATTRVLCDLARRVLEDNGEDQAEWPAIKATRWVPPT